MGPEAVIELNTKAPNIDVVSVELIPGRVRVPVAGSIQQNQRSGNLRPVDPRDRARRDRSRRIFENRGKQLRHSFRCGHLHPIGNVPLVERAAIYAGWTKRTRWRCSRGASDVRRSDQCPACGARNCAGANAAPSVAGRIEASVRQIVRARRAHPAAIEARDPYRNRPDSTPVPHVTLKNCPDMRW